MWWTWPVVALETQSEPAPVARRSGAVCGPRRRRTTWPPFALTAVIPAPLGVGDPDAAAAVDQRARVAADVDALR